MIDLYNEDCLEVMDRLIAEGVKVDSIITDLPYGVSASYWDVVIPFEEIWKRFKVLIKDNGAIVIFGVQPFTSMLIMSNLEMYKYSWVWEKDNGTNFMNSHFQPIKKTEDICVFGNGAVSYTKTGKNLKYNPQMKMGKPYICRSGKQKSDSAIVRDKKTKLGGVVTANNGYRFPNNILRFNRDKTKMHPTQKPVLLMEYLVKTYTDEGDLVLDCCIGSGTTGVACKRLGRDFIGIENNKSYFEMAKARIDAVS